MYTEVDTYIDPLRGSGCRKFVGKTAWAGSYGILLESFMKTHVD